MTRARQSKVLNQRPETTFSRDGKTAFVTLEVDRLTFELCRFWARLHYGAVDGAENRHCTAEDQLQGYLDMKMMEALDDAPDAFFAEIPAHLLPVAKEPDTLDMKDGIPF